MGNDNGLLGKYIAFHEYRGNITATLDGYEDKYEYGRKPTAAMLPNFRNVYKQEMDFLRGYMVHYSASRPNWQQGYGKEGIGVEFKESVNRSRRLEYIYDDAGGNDSDRKKSCSFKQGPKR